MENRSHAMMAGLFVLALITAAVIAAIWIGRKNVTYEPYEMVTNLPVGGLSVQSQVRYQGIQVGQVQGLTFDEKHPGKILIRIGIMPDTPITRGTWAEITTQGVTGISNIDLRDTGDDPVRVTSSVQQPYMIPVKPGLLQRLQTAGASVVGDFEEIVKRLEMFASPQNAQAFTEILANTRTLTATLEQVVVKLEPTFDELPALAKDLRQSMHVFNQVGGEVSSLAKAIRTNVDMLNSPSGPIGLATASLKQLERSAAQLQTSVLPEINRVLESLGQASRTVTRAMQEVERAPQSLLFGAPAVQPGPGEAGFAGFTR